MFRTKCEEQLTLPVTEEVRVLINQCRMDTDLSFVRQLWMKDFSGRGWKLSVMHAARLRTRFRALCKQAGITRRITPHDLRRTTAVAMYRATGDLRDAQAILGHKNLQSTLWYLDHEIRPVSRKLLEQIKQPAWRKEHIA